MVFKVTDTDMKEPMKVVVRNKNEEIVMKVNVSILKQKGYRKDFPQINEWNSEWCFSLEGTYNPWSLPFKIFNLNSGDPSAYVKVYRVEGAQQRGVVSWGTNN